jgi:hypothetical protein
MKRRPGFLEPRPHRIEVRMPRRLVAGRPCRDQYGAIAGGDGRVHFLERALRVFERHIRDAAQARIVSAECRHRLVVRASAGIEHAFASAAELPLRAFA